MPRTLRRTTDGQRAWVSSCVNALGWLGLLIMATHAFGQPPAAPISKTPAAPQTKPQPVPAAPPKAEKPSAPAATPSAAPTVPTAQPPLPGEVGPELYLLRDREGHLQAVPGFSFEDFIELYRLKNQLGRAEERPRYVVSNAVMTGKVRGQAVASNLVLTIESGDANWVRIPLGLSTSIIDGAVTVDGTGEVLIEFTDRPVNAPPNGGQDWASNRTGYVLWLRGDARKKQTVTIPLITRVSTVGDETQLRLEMPRASTAQVVVEVPVSGALARVSDGATLLEPQTQANSTTFSVVGASGLVELAWRPPGSTALAAPNVLEASGFIWARIDGHSVGWEAKLSVRSFGGQFSGFRVRLPPGAQLLGDGQAGVNVVPVAATDGDTGATIIEVKLDRKTAGPVEVRLLADRPRNPDKPDELLELAGFEVLNVVRQWGAIGVQLVGNWQLEFGESRGVRQVDDMPEEVRREEYAAAFEYSTQPCSMLAKVSPRRTRVSVQPQYMLQVGARETRIVCDLKYTIRGAKLRSLSLQMPGWEIDEIGPANLVNVDAAAIDDTSAFSIPLAQPSNGDLAITVTARRVTPGNGSVDAPHAFECDLPRPQAEVIAPALVVIQADDNVELIPRSDSLVGLSLRSLRPTLKLAARQQDPLFYQAEGVASHFAGELRVHGQKILIQAENRVVVEEQEVSVDQELRYNIQFEPTEKLALLVPRAVPIDKLEAYVDGNRLPVTAVGEDKPGERRAFAPASIALGGSRIGRCELILSYRLPQERLPPVTSVPLTIPLCVPADGELVQNRSWVRSGAELALSARKGAWKPFEHPRNLGLKPDGLWFSAEGSAESIELAETLQDRSRGTATLVERGWIQTWLTGSGRQDRVVLCLISGDRNLQLMLPAGLKASEVEVLVDGQSVELGVASDGKVNLPLSTSVREERHFIQLEYHLPTRPSTGVFTLEPPTLLPAAWMNRLYWQVFLPEHEHVVFTPSGFVGESEWNWNGKYWGRGPTLDSKDLAQWIGLPTTLVGLPETRSGYLFSAIGECQPMQLRTVRRSSLVFVASLCVLGGGLALIYFPVIRHPVSLLAIAVAVLGLGALAPDLAVLAVQAGVLGLILVTVAVFLNRRAKISTGQQNSTPAMEREGVPEPTTTDLYYRTPSAAVPQSTATSPMILPGSGAELPT